MADSARKRPPIPVIIAVVVLLIGGGIWWWWSSTQASSSATNQYSGSVEANSYPITPALAGRIAAVKVAEGDQVSAGQVLVQLDDSAFKLQVTQARQGVTAANAALTNARDDGTTADVTAAKAKVAQAEAAVKIAEIQLGYTTVTAPRAGVVTSLVANVGQNGAPGKTLLTILDSSDAFVRLYVPETQIGKVSIGQSAKVTTDSSTNTFDGQVSYIASESEFTPNTVQTKDQRVKLVYQVRVKLLDTSGTLKAGLPVDVTLG